MMHIFLLHNFYKLLLEDQCVGTFCETVLQIKISLLALKLSENQQYVTFFMQFIILVGLSPFWLRLHQIFYFLIAICTFIFHYLINTMYVSISLPETTFPSTMSYARTPHLTAAGMSKLYHHPEQKILWANRFRYIRFEMKGKSKVIDLISLEC